MTAIITIASGIVRIAAGFIVALIACVIASMVAPHIPILPRIVLWMACAVMFFTGCIAVDLGIDEAIEGANGIGGDDDGEPN